MGYSFRLAARWGFSYAPSHRQDNAYHSFCYTSRGVLAEKTNSSMGPLKGQSEKPLHDEWVLYHVDDDDELMLFVLLNPNNNIHYWCVTKQFVFISDTLYPLNFKIWLHVS